MSVESNIRDITIERTFKAQTQPYNGHDLDHQEEQRLSNELYSALHCHRPDSGLFDHQQSVRSWTGLQRPTKVKHLARNFALDIAERMVNDERIDSAIYEFSLTESAGYGAPHKVLILLQKYLVGLYIEACEVVAVGERKKKKQSPDLGIKRSWRRLKPIYPGVFVEKLSKAEIFTKDGGWWFSEEENKAWGSKGFIRSSKAYSNLEDGLRSLRQPQKSFVEVEAR